MDCFDFNAGFIVIAGPCVIEDEISCLEAAAGIKKICEEFAFPFVFKSSYYKANRSSVDSFAGPGIDEGLRVLKRIKDDLAVPVLTDVHCSHEVKKCAEVVDVLQIPAFLCRQTPLILAAARTGLPVNVKKGQFLSPGDAGNIIKKIESTGNRKIAITERGTTFGYNNLVVDMRSFPIMKDFGYPVIFDATHSVQLPGGLGVASGGESRFVLPLARAAAAAGCDGLFLETHANPPEALCDGPNMLSLPMLREVLAQVRLILDAEGRIR